MLFACQGELGSLKEVGAPWRGLARRAGWERRVDAPGDFPGLAPQKTHILIGFVPFVLEGRKDVELGFRFERG